MHVFRTPSGQEIHGMFPSPQKIGASPYQQHPNFPGRRVYTSGIHDVIATHDIPERRMNESYLSCLPKVKKRGYTQMEIKEATQNRIDKISKLHNSNSDGHPGIGRIR